MARFLLAAYQFSGHLHPNLAVGHALRDLGHEVAFYTAPSHRALVESEGFRYFPFDHLDGAWAESIILHIGRLRLPWDGLRMRALSRAWLIGTAAEQIADIDAILTRWRPDALVCDPTMLGILLVAPEGYQLPTAVFSHLAGCLLPGPNGPIPGISLRPSDGRLGGAIRTLVQRVVDWLNRDIRQDAAVLRRRHGLPPLDMTVAAYTGTLPLYLVQSSPEYDYFRRDLPPSVRYVGPCLWDRPSGSPPPTWLEEIAEDRPLVYVTEGTTHVKEPYVLQAAVRGLADLPVSVVVTTGQHRDPATLDLDPLPRNVRVEQFVPQSYLLPRCAAVVTTGGSNTVLATLREGVPLVIVPSAWDQPENAWRVADAGAGIRLPSSRCTPSRLRQAVEQVLVKPSYRSNASRLAASFRRHGGAAEAAALLELCLLPPAGGRPVLQSIPNAESAPPLNSMAQGTHAS